MTLLPAQDSTINQYIKKHSAGGIYNAVAVKRNSDGKTCERL